MQDRLDTDARLAALRSPTVAQLDRDRLEGTDPMMAIFGAILPRLLLLVGWSNDQTYWNALLGQPVWLLGGFLFFPWTTLFYGFVQRNPDGLSLLNIIFLGLGAADRPWDVGRRVLREPPAGLQLPRVLVALAARPARPPGSARRLIQVHAPRRVPPSHPPLTVTPSQRARPDPSTDA